jgi:hypothetical protein
MGFLGLVSEALFRCLLFLGECEALSFFPTSCAFLSVVSAFAVSHKSSTVALLSRCGKLVALGDCHRTVPHQSNRPEVPVGSAKFDLAKFYLPEYLHTKTTVKIFYHA